VVGSVCRGRFTGLSSVGSAPFNFNLASFVGGYYITIERLGKFCLYSKIFARGVGGVDESVLRYVLLQSSV
jgi:hypothetical protein